MWFHRPLLAGAQSPPFAAPLGPDFRMNEQNFQPEEEPVVTLWSKMVQGILGILLILGLGVMDVPTRGLRRHPQQVHQLSAQVEQIEQEQAMPAMVLDRFRNSICYIFGVYPVGFPGQKPALRTRISGTGFVVADGLLGRGRPSAAMSSLRRIGSTSASSGETGSGRRATACEGATRPLSAGAGEHQAKIRALVPGCHPGDRFRCCTVPRCRGTA